MPEHSAYYRERPHRRQGRDSNLNRYQNTGQGSDPLALSLAAQMVSVLLLIAAIWLLRGVNSEGYQDFRGQYDTLTSESFAVLPGESTVMEDINRWLSGLLERLPINSFDSPADTAPPPQTPAIQYDYLAPSAQGQGGESPQPPPGGAWLSPAFFTAPMRPPVSGAVTSAFGWREHPITGAADFHNGMDIAAPEGHSILAPIPGVVAQVGYSSIYGNFITLEHSGNLYTSYSHCSEIIAREGMKLRQGERIAKVGSTGVSTGPHLHFAVIAHGIYTDPYWALSDFIVVERR